MRRRQTKRRPGSQNHHGHLTRRLAGADHSTACHNIGFAYSRCPCESLGMNSTTVVSFYCRLHGSMRGIASAYFSAFSRAAASLSSVPWKRHHERSANAPHHGGIDRPAATVTGACFCQSRSVASRERRELSGHTAKFQPVDTSGEMALVDSIGHRGHDCNDIKIAVELPEKMTSVALVVLSAAAACVRCRNSPPISERPYVRDLPTAAACVAETGQLHA